MSIASALRKLRGREAVDPTAPTAASGGFAHDREPRPEWTAALREVSPMTELHGTLEYVWEPGDPWTPGQRWTIYETISQVQAVEASFERLMALRGPNPRLGGHMCTAKTVPGQFACLCKVKLDGWRQEDGSPSDVTLGEWKLFQRTGRVGRLFLIVQGKRGGHKAFLTREEKMFLAAAGKKTDMPAIGELAYAEPDARTIAQVVQFNRLRSMAVGIGDYRRRMKGKGFQLQMKEAEKTLRKQLVEWLDESMADDSDGPSINDLFMKAANAREMDAHAPRTDIDWEKVGEQGIDSYVETGQLLHPSKVK